MALNSAEVNVAVTGAVAVGPTSTTAPLDATTALTGTKDLGYVDEAGVTETRERSTTKLKAWQNADTVREVVTDASITYKFKLVQTNADTVGLYYGTTVDATDGSVVIKPAATGGRQAFVIDVVDGTDYIRAWIPEGELTAVGDQTYASGEAIAYDVTITAYPATSLSGGSVKKFYSRLDTTP
jgi:hypothetical protein